MLNFSFGTARSGLNSGPSRQPRYLLDMNYQDLKYMEITKGTNDSGGPVKENEELGLGYLGKPGSS